MVLITPDDNSCCSDAASLAIFSSLFLEDKLLKHSLRGGEAQRFHSSGHSRVDYSTVYFKAK